MSKAEEFIKKQSHIIENPTSVWISSYNARKAVEIAKEEMIDKACNVIRHKYGHYHYLRGDITEELIKEFVKAMKDE